MLAAAGRVPDDDDRLSGDELFSLQNNVRYQLARALRNQALCYGADTTDRVAALTAAVKQLNATLTQLQPSDALVWQVYLDLAQCYRLSADLAQARRALTAPLAETTPRAARFEAVAELARILTDEGRPQQGLDEISRARTKWQSSSAELDFAELETMLAIWYAAAQRKDELLAGQWQKKVAEAVAAMERSHGAYWGRRAKLGQLRVAGTGMAEGDIEIVRSTADELYHKRQYDEAIRTYEKASELAHAAGDLSQATEIESLASRVEELLNRMEAASRRQRRLALELPSQTLAPDLHYSAILNLIKAVRNDPTLADRYQLLLEEHLQRWPASTRANTVRQWLGDWYRVQQRWEDAIAAYRQITPDAENFVPVLPQLADCWNRWLQQRLSAGEPISTVLTDATNYFDALILGPTRQWPERWSPAQLDAALVTARLRLQYAPQGLLDAQRVLQAALEHAPADQPQWLEEAQSLLVVALAGQPGQQQQALTLLQQLGAGSVDRRLQLLEQLSVVAASATAETRGQIAQVQLTALDQLGAGAARLDAQQRLHVDRVRADALRTAGRTQDALAIYRRLAKELPNNGAIQMDYGELLLTATDQQTLTDAVLQWQQVARRVPPTSEDRLRAGYNIALARYKRNRPAAGSDESDRALAAKGLKLLKITYDLQQSKWQELIDQLLQKCEQRGGN